MVIELKMPGGVDAAASLTQVKLLATRFPGEHELTIMLDTSRAGTRRLRLGPTWKYDASPGCLAALAEFGELISPRV